ncbi:MAG TPA: ABC transporter ATP-binding protein [Burkholderiales bacterium]|nr:ABC transporter ATP-binding protein [Burkholderiales bacterium]
MAVRDEPQPLLRVENVAVHFGGIVALDGVSFDVERGQIVGLIGPNGAGKTTLFNCLSRLYPLDRGDIRFEGTSLLELPIHRIAQAGIGRTFQNLALFRTMTVLQNVMAGGHCRSSGGFFSNALRLPFVQREEDGLHAEAMKIVALLELGAVAHARVMDLPFGTQKRVELGRALAAKPKLLLLDEPAGGLNHEEVSALATLMKHVRDALGITILLVEHHMSLVMSTSDRVVALNFGRKIAEGTPAEVRRHADVISAYLGTTH